MLHAIQFGKPPRKWPRYRGLSASPEHRANSWQRYVGTTIRPPLPKTCAKGQCRLTYVPRPGYQGPCPCGCGCGPKTMGDPVETLLDIFSGGPQKRARIARDERYAAEAQRDAAIAQAKSAAEVAQIQLEYQRQQWDQAKDLIVKGGVVVGAAVAAYLVLR